MSRRFWKSPSTRVTEDLEAGQGAAHDVAVAHDTEAGLDGSAPAPEVEEASSDLEVALVSFNRQRSEERHHNSEVEPANELVPPILTSGGFGIGSDELGSLVRDRDLQALNQYNGVEGLSTLLNTDLERGIARRDDEILQRRQTFGSNTYPCKKGKPFRCFLWKASLFPLYLVMIIAAVITFLLLIKGKAIHDGWYVGASIILVILLDIIVRAITEYRQSRHFEKFSEEKRNVRLEVIRGGRRVSVCTYDIVVGDIVPLKNGCQVPADGVLFFANSLKINEEEITGSHETVLKDRQLDPFVLSGSKLTEGIGTMMVTSVGINTEWGLTMEIPRDDQEKPFQVYLNRLAIYVCWLVVLFPTLACILHLSRYFYGRTKNSERTPRNTTFDEAMEFVIKSLSFEIATIIVAVPVGLSVAVRLNLAKTVRKMMKDNIMVQTLSACERMGSVSIILCQKTGILTINQMSVVDVWAGGIRMQNMDNVSQFPTFLKQLIIEGVAQNTNGSVVFETGVTEPELYGSPTEQAILRWGNKLGMNFDEARSASLVHHIIPFNPNKKYGGVALQLDTRAHVHWKGSANIILSSCISFMDGTNNVRAIDEQQRNAFEGIIENMCIGRMRCAALAYRPYELESLPSPEELSRRPQDLVLLAIIGIQDPCRPGTREEIERCNSGGVKVCMVTEDNVLTAQAIAMECGILRDASGRNIRTAAQFCDLTDTEREQIAGDISVFAQASPRDILRLVEALKNSRHVVAATGMGVHDTKTLLKVDVSLGMGNGGSAAAKENSNFIILDDTFATIVQAIVWCRSIHTNIQRYVLFRLTVCVSAMAICVVEVVFYNAFPLNAAQLLFLNLIVDIFGALALAYKPTAHNLMAKPPAGIRDSFITKTMWFKLVIQVIYLVLFLVFINSELSEKILKLKHGYTVDTEKVMNTFIFNSLVFCLAFSELEIRSGDQNFKEILRDNMFLVTITSTIIFQILVIEFLGIFISAVKLDWKKWLISILVGFLSHVATHFPFQAYQYYRN